MFYFNTNVLHFSNTDLGTINVVCSVANILGVWTYRILFKDTPFKKMLLLTTACLALTQLGKLLLTQSLTESALRLSPLTYTYINQLLFTLVNELHLMPLMILACKMCPKQVEASFYAFVLAVINLGYLVSYQLGGLITFALGITATSFANLWILVVLSAIFPLLTQLLLLFLPEKYDVNEEIRKYFESKRKATSDVDVRSSSSVKVKMNIRDGIEEDECLVDE